MKQLVSITSQGQLTIPVALRREFGITGATKATICRDGDRIIVQPGKDFWGAVQLMHGGKIKLSDKQLRAARARFEKEWAEPN